MAQKRNPVKTILVTLIIIIVLLGMVGAGILSSQAPSQPPAEEVSNGQFDIDVSGSGEVQVTPIQ